MLVREYKAPPTVWRFINDNSYISGIVGPFGSGKSVGSVMKMLRYATLQEPGDDRVRRTRWAVVRNTYRQLRETTIKTFMEWVPEFINHEGEQVQVGVYHKTEQRFVLGRDRKGNLTCPLPDGTFVEAEFIFKALDRPESEGDLLSLELSGAWVNEFREIDLKLFTGVFGRTGRYPAPRSGAKTTNRMLIADSNPMMLEGGYYNFFVKREGVDELQEELRKALEADGVELDRDMMNYFKQPGGLHPNAENKENLDPSYYHTMGIMAQASGKSMQWVKVHRDAEYGIDVSGRPVYERDFNDAIHVSDAPLLVDPKLAIAVGMDFGLTPAAVFAQRDNYGRWQIFSELTTPVDSQMGTVQFLTMMKDHIRKNYPNHECVIYADPAGQQKAQTDMKTSFEIAKAMGFRIYPGAYTLEERIGSVRASLTRIVEGVPGLRISRGCTVLMQGFQGAYQYKRVAVSDEKYSEKPDKNRHSHVHDATQHLFGYFDGPMLRNKLAKTFPRNSDVRRRREVTRMKDWNPNTLHPHGRM
jgi:hypothetical protein